MVVKSKEMGPLFPVKCRLMKYYRPVVATQTFWNFHPDPWGNDPIWRAYFSNGWLNHQLVYQPLAFSTFIHYLSTHHHQPTIIFNGFQCPTILRPRILQRCFKPSRFAMHVLVFFGGCKTSPSEWSLQRWYSDVDILQSTMFGYQFLPKSMGGFGIFTWFTSLNYILFCRYFHQPHLILGGGNSNIFGIFTPIPGEMIQLN